MRNVGWIALLVVLSGCAKAESPESPGERASGGSPSFPADRPNAETSEVVAVDWLGRGQLFAGRINGRRGNLTGIVYADGDREWVEESRISAWPNLVGQRAQVWTRSSARNVEVLEQRHGLYHVRFDDGADTWASRDMLYALSAPAATGTSGTPSQFTPRSPELEAVLSVGDHVLAYWISDGELQRTQPWLAEVMSMTGPSLRLRYSDGSEAAVPRAAILRVFDPASARTTVGQRVWVADAAPVGTIIDARSGLVKVRAGDAERWVETENVIGNATPIEAGRLEAGVFVTALWNSSALYHATVVSLENGQVTLAWHDGSTPSAVPIAEVLEVWQLH